MYNWLARFYKTEYHFRLLPWQPFIRQVNNNSETANYKTAIKNLYQLKGYGAKSYHLEDTATHLSTDKWNNDNYGYYNCFMALCLRLPG